jgi:tripartite-type tricarboxylate transporter receptor subunit TctC
LLPETQTLADAGLEGVKAENFFSVYAPAGTPSPIIERANAEIAHAMRSPALAARLEGQAWLPVFESPAEFAASLKREREQWAAFIRRNGISLEQ